MSIQTKRQAAFQSQSGRCYYCGFGMWTQDVEAYARVNRITVRQARLFECTAEHLIARCNGGTDEPRNIVAACRRCNVLRHAGRHGRAPDPVTYKCRVQARLRAGRWHMFGPTVAPDR